MVSITPCTPEDTNEEEEKEQEYARNIIETREFFLTDKC